MLVAAFFASAVVAAVSAETLDEATGLISLVRERKVTWTDEYNLELTQGVGQMEMDGRVNDTQN